MHSRQRRSPPAGHARKQPCAAPGRSGARSALILTTSTRSWSNPTSSVASLVKVRRNSAAATTRITQKRNLHDDERARQRQAACTCAGAAALFNNRLHRRHACRAVRRRDAKEQRRDHGGAGRDQVRASQPTGRETPYWSASCATSSWLPQRATRNPTPAPSPKAGGSPSAAAAPVANATRPAPAARSTRAAVQWPAPAQVCDVRARNQQHQHDDDHDRQKRTSVPRAQR